MTTLQGFLEGTLKNTYTHNLPKKGLLKAHIIVSFGSLVISLPVGQICGYPQISEPLQFTQNLVYAYLVPTYAR